MPGVTTTTSRTSLEKARSIKLFKNSLENDSQNGHGHKKSESLMSERVLQDDGQRSLAEVGNEKSIRIHAFSNDLHYRTVSFSRNLMT